MPTNPDRSLPPTAVANAAKRFLAGRIDYERSRSMPNSEEAFKLDRMRELLQRLDNPQNRFAVVHVAGTKGKGSTSAMIAGVLTAAGYRTGLFTSPHLERVEERIVIDGKPCTPEELATLVELVRPTVEQMDRAAAGGSSENGPTYFEILTAMAIVHFARRGVKAAVLEVGLGGRLDSTNVCQPRVSVITSISLDHTQQLGNTLAAIAGEKAGIIKPGVPVVSGVTSPEPRDVIRRIAAERGCQLVEFGVDFDVDYHPPRRLESAPSLPTFDYKKPASTGAAACSTAENALASVPIGLLGRHQGANAAIAVAVIEQLRLNGWSIPDEAIRRGLAEVRWPARVEVVARRPTVLLDAAHNAASIRALAEVLEESFSVRRRLLVFATTEGKDVAGMLRHLRGRFDHVILTKYLENPRGIPAERLHALATACWGDSSAPCRASVIEIAATPADAWAAVHRLAQPDDLVCITGSFFLAAEMRRQIDARPLGAAVAGCQSNA
ncbi:MAG: bifunctional folylpolyglutamate synthase/dihydrofolate synthase [Planctomycetaceae bacterium]|nr:bifunctional folylpolyglutamate synthase/dihydrofolate synthase [Planctomycetaceae bacterium]